MGIRDGMRFVAWYISKFGTEPYPATPEIELLREAYSRGFDDGCKAAADYDPLWDAD